LAASTAILGRLPGGVPPQDGGASVARILLWQVVYGGPGDAPGCPTQSLRRAAPHREDDIMVHHRAVCRALLTGALGLVLLGGPAKAATPDAWITTKAKMALLTTEGVSATAVNVDTVDGQVTLHGKVGSEAEKAKAEDAVKRIDGVRTVRNLLQVVPEQREKRVEASDDEIKSKVKQALDRDGTLKSVSVQSVNNGVVLLKGDVDTLSAHLRAIETASEVPGVRRVVSEIRSPDKLADAEIYSDKPQSKADTAKHSFTDAWVTSAVKFRLLADDRTPGKDINVDTRGGRVTLFGIVDSEAAKKAATEDAQKVSGVRAVNNELEVVSSARKENVEASDERVERRVRDALSSQSELSDASIDVEVHNGVARLKGTVANETDRMRATAVARTADGVRAVRDELRVSSAK
jgi:hyperosmotically inducible protein